MSLSSRLRERARTVVTARAQGNKHKQTGARTERNARADGASSVSNKAHTRGSVSGDDDENAALPRTCEGGRAAIPMSVTVPLAQLRRCAHLGHCITRKRMGRERKALQRGQ